MLAVIGMPPKRSIDQSPARKSARRKRVPVRLSEGTTDSAGIDTTLTTASQAPPPNHDLLTQVQELKSSVATLTGIVQSIMDQQRTQQTTQAATSSEIQLDEHPPAAATNYQNTALPDPISTTAIPGELLPSTNQRPLMLSSGVRAGQQLPDKVRQDILSDKYVDFQSIAYPNQEQAYTMSLDGPNEGPVINFAPKKRRPLSENEWSSAWDDFVAVYADAYPHKLSDLITYGKSIKAMMAKNQNWRTYDEQFRKDRELTLCSWASVRVDLQLSTAQPLPQTSIVQNHNAQLFRGYSTSKTPAPNGFCFRFHTQGTRCNQNQCPYKHRCPKCNGTHPVFLCNRYRHPKAFSSNEPSTSQKQNQRDNSSKRPKTK